MKNRTTRDFRKTTGNSQLDMQRSLPLLGGALALLIAGYAIVTRDREILGQVWEFSKYLICAIVIGPVLRTGRT